MNLFNIPVLTVILVSLLLSANPVSAHYDPGTQRWLNRDPLADFGSLTSRTPALVSAEEADQTWADASGQVGDAWVQLNRNLYSAMENNAVNLVDTFGLEPALDSVDANPSMACELALEEEGVAARGLNLASKLARNMARAGRGVRQGDQAHHIIAENSKFARPARTLLKKFKIDINDPANGVGLPKDFHIGVHNRTYYNTINQMARSWTTRQEALEGLRTIGSELRTACAGGGP
jgi:hypothetical protein